MAQLVYPIIFRYDDMTIPSGHDFPKVWNITFRGTSDFDTTESIAPEARFHWLIDGNAEIREIELKSKSREWLRPFRHIWCGVRDHYSMACGRKVTVGQLTGILEGTRLDDEKSLTPALNDFLAEYESDSILTPSMLEEFNKM